ncbi:hypothetical protein PE067_15125 [Paracoccus sp. DMF-8]|uniref:hypothetical protein n=1 Tax=Paracoccus sp. DMF-8 TaxID=3019445 RepID=UPI0023E44646|nr:hypothetical protein [Paracoccus sp. DMF-8]MDF3607347.1 hypothetical protein [Paracoccus sp. DMF-8]
MTFSTRHFLITLPFLALAGCQTATTTANTPNQSQATTKAATQAATTVAATVAPARTAPTPRPTARTAEEFNTTTPEQRSEAAKPTATGERKLGNTIASLGDPTQPGFWIKTPLVTDPGKGRIRNPANGRSARVELVPLAGPASGGSQVSLPALQLIGVSLTDLPSIEVFQE